MPVSHVPEELVRFFAADGIGPQFTLSELLTDPDHEMYTLAEVALDMFSEEDLESRRQALEDMGLWNDDQPDELERRALESLLEEKLNRAVAKYRMQILLESDSESRPLPYGLSAASGLEVDGEGLTDMRQFQGFVGPFRYGDYLFALLLPLPAQNSAYWLTLALRGLARRSESSILVRLDPTLHGPVGHFSQMELRAWWYGTDLDWNEISGLKGVIHRQAGPDARSKGIMSRTDIAWVRRGKEVHFVCEELPPQKDLEVRGSRYLHAVYRPDLSAFVHVDGAVRLFTPGELERRWAEKVHEGGKAGRRIKIFRIDGIVTQDDFGTLAATLFYGNPDVAEYLQGKSSESPIA